MAVHVAERSLLVVQAVTGLPEAEQGGAGDSRVVEPDDPPVVRRGVGELAGRKEVRASLQQRQGDVATQAALRDLARLVVRDARRAHGLDCTGAARPGPAA